VINKLPPILFFALVGFVLAGCGTGVSPRGEKHRVVPTEGSDVFYDALIAYDLSGVVPDEAHLVFPVMFKDGVGYFFPYWNEQRSRKGFMDAAYQETVRAFPMQEVRMDRFYITGPVIDDQTELVIFVTHPHRDTAPGDTMLSDVQGALGDWNEIRYIRQGKDIRRSDKHHASVDVNAMVKKAWDLYRQYAKAHGQ